MLRDLRQLLYTAAYHPREIARILDKRHPSFVAFDPVLGYVLKDYIFRDGQGGILCDYSYERRGGHRQMVNYRHLPCRLNTYGDSYTQCAQVSCGETWQEILAAHFREPIRNFGVGGYGVYQAYRRLLRTEAMKDLAAEYLILNIWDDDHYRNLDAARWIRVAWMCRDLPRGGGKKSYPVHGFPWAHVRYDVDRGRWVEMPGLCRRASDLRRLVGKENYYRAFKDDPVAHLYTLRQGGQAPTAANERLAEAFGLKVDLRQRNRQRRMADALRLHTEYALRATMYILDRLQEWARRNQRKLMIILTYDVPTVTRFIRTGERFDEKLLAYLRRSRLPWIDCLRLAAEEYKLFKLPLEKWLGRYYISRAGAQVFGHYSPAGNFWFAHAIRPYLVEWLQPKPPAYR